MLFISIPKPCNENWDDLTPRDQGAFCSVCSKTVVDFTTLSDEEVKNYFFQHREQKTCGRFRNDQLAAPRTLPELLSRPIPFWKKFLAIVIVLFGTFLSGCEDSTVGKIKIKQQGATANELKESLHVTTGITLTDIVTDTIFTRPFCTTEIGDIKILSDGIVEPDSIEVDGIMPIQVIGEPEIKPDTIFFVGEIKEETFKKISPVLPKIDSIKKLINQCDCDTIPMKSIEP